MAPLNPNNTGRYFVDYTVGIHEHTAMVRANAALSPASFGTQINNLLTALTPVLFALTIVRIRWAASGSNVSNPVASGIEGSVYGGSAPANNDYPKFLDFVGRSTGGRRVRNTWFGYKGGLDDFRVTTAESTAIAAALPNITGGANSWLSIDGLKPVWYNYVDVGYNAYWQRAVRQ